MKGEWQRAGGRTDGETPLLASQYLTRNEVYSSKQVVAALIRSAVTRLWLEMESFRHRWFRGGGREDFFRARAVYKCRLWAAARTLGRGVK